VAEITDDFMRSMLSTAKAYTAVLLTRGPAYDGESDRAVIWEHGRRNFRLRDEGKLAVVCPMTDDGPVRGLAIFATGPEETTRIMQDDPAVQAGVLEFEVHTTMGFPGDSLP
jgi:hypothetical protein